MTQSLKIVVLAKQVPDTRNVGKDAMTAEGTVNRAALSAIFNPEDLLALEVALKLKDQNPATVVELLTMGPGRAAEIIREGLFRGADGGILLTDKKFMGSDTLATSYALSRAIRKLHPDLIVAGRQAIDGDTAQVGPQVAEKLGLPQITYVEDVLSLSPDEIIVRRRLEHGVETVKGKLPLVLTVNASAPVCRPRNAKRLMKYKHAKTASELQTQDLGYIEFHKSRTYLNISEWGVSDIEGEEEQFGSKGSPTKVKKVENVIFKTKESKRLSDSDIDIELLIKELIANHTIG
jgi:electron transfer flavoprotein beta subunit